MTRSTVDTNDDDIVDRPEFAAEKERQKNLGDDGEYKGADAEGDWQYEGEDQAP